MTELCNSLPDVLDYIKQAAAERKALQSDNDRLNEAYETMLRDLQARTKQLAEARDEVERLKQELEAAVNDLKLDRNCALCKHLQNQRFCAEQCQIFFDDFGIKRIHPKWQWRGVKED